MLQRGLDLAPEVAGLYFWVAGPGSRGGWSDFKNNQNSRILQCFLAPEVAGPDSRGGWTWLQRWLDFIFGWLDFIFGWLDLAPEGSGLNPKGMVFASQVPILEEGELANGLRAMEIG